MNTKAVATDGGYENLFKVSEYRSMFYVYKIKIGAFTNSSIEIGHTGSFEDALNLIKNYSGYGIKSIRDWD